MVAAMGILTWCGICLWPRTRQKAKMDIVLTKSPDFDDIIAQESQATAGNDVAAELEGNLPCPCLLAVPHDLAACYMPEYVPNGRCRDVSCLATSLN